MKVNIVQIGNSKGIRIPASVLTQCHIGTEVEMNIENQIELIINDKKDEIILKPVHKIREGWNESFKKMKNSSDDKLIIEDSLDLNDWEW